MWAQPLIKVGEKLVSNAARQWGTPAQAGNGLQKAVNAAPPAIGLGGILAGYGGEYLENTIGVTIPEAVPSTLIGAALYNSTAANGKAPIVDKKDLADRERALDAERVRKFEELIAR